MLKKIVELLAFNNNIELTLQEVILLDACCDKEESNNIDDNEQHTACIQNLERLIGLIMSPIRNEFFGYNQTYSQQIIIRGMGSLPIQYSKEISIKMIDGDKGEKSFSWNELESFFKK